MAAVAQGAKRLCGCNLYSANW